MSVTGPGCEACNFVGRVRVATGDDRPCDACGGFSQFRHRDEAAAPAAPVPSTAEALAAIAEARRLRALLAGSTTPPSDAELADGGDLWVVTSPHSSGYRVSVLGSDEARAYRDAAKGAHVWHRWDEAMGCPMERER